MRHASKKNDEVPVSEMEIVNTFTKLIFGDEAYSTRELFIIDAFRVVDVNVMRDDLADLGGYLRDLGVREMIQLVARVHRHLAESMQSLPSTGAKQPRSAKVVQDNPNRNSR
jgi:hypothetical protein